MQNSVWKITVWVWVVLYVALTSFSNGYSFSNEHSSQTELQENAAFNKLDFYSNLAVHPQTSELLSVALNLDKTTDYWDFIAVNYRVKIRDKALQKINFLVDYEAVVYSFSGLDQIYPFHSFW